MPLYDRFVSFLTMVEKNTFVIIHKTYYFSLFNKNNGIGMIFFNFELLMILINDPILMII